MKTAQMIITILLTIQVPDTAVLARQIFHIRPHPTRGILVERTKAKSWWYLQIIAMARQQERKYNDKGIL